MTERAPRYDRILDKSGIMIDEEGNSISPLIGF